MHAGLTEAIPNVMLRAAYDKAGIESFGDAFSLDQRSLATAELGYKTFSYFYVSILYRWTFRFSEAKDRYVTQKRVEPRISFVMNF